MNALIIANGPLPPLRILRKLIASSAIIVCADGGANRARALNITPDIILGDLDSITPPTKKYFSRVPVLRIDDQYSTDLEKAITFCLRLRIATAFVAGALGGRIDHATGSLGCFKKFRNNIGLSFYDAHGILTLVGKQLSLRTRKGQKCSLIPLNRCTGVTTKHLRYKLNNDILELGIREGISNEATASRISIEVKKGTLLLYMMT